MIWAIVIVIIVLILKKIKKRTKRIRAEEKKKFAEEEARMQKTFAEHGREYSREYGNKTAMSEKL